MRKNCGKSYKKGKNWQKRRRNCKKIKKKSTTKNGKKIVLKLKNEEKFLKKPANLEKYGKRKKRKLSLLIFFFQAVRNKFFLESGLKIDNIEKVLQISRFSLQKF